MAALLASGRNKDRLVYCARKWLPRRADFPNHLLTLRRSSRSGAAFASHVRITRPRLSSTLFTGRTRLDHDAQGSAVHSRAPLRVVSKRIIADVDSRCSELLSSGWTENGDGLPPFRRHEKRKTIFTE
jgi:hypothetical protein